MEKDIDQEKIKQISLSIKPMFDLAVKFIEKYEEGNNGRSNKKD